MGRKLPSKSTNTPTDGPALIAADPGPDPIVVAGRIDEVRVAANGVPVGDARPLHVHAVAAEQVVVRVTVPAAATIPCACEATMLFRNSTVPPLT